MNEDVAILVEGLSKRYRIGALEEMPDSFGDALMNWIKFPLRSFKALRSLTAFGEEEREDVIWALKDVSFEVKKGEVLGIIGKNGAGKSTLLKLLSRITKPTAGRALINGRVNSLLEVGTGFHPELSGRDNVYLNGTILGMSRREVDAKFGQIVAFSGVGKFIDTPVKRYSSGMKVRLAFAVAAHLEPEVLIIDEVLAVGDAEFQRKCLGKMDEVARSGRTVLFVSHNMSAVSNLCSRCILLKDGLMIAEGDTDDVINRYTSIFDLETEYNSDEAGDKPVHLQKVYAECGERTDAGNRLLYYSKPFYIVMEYSVREPLDRWYVGVSLRTLADVVVFATADYDENPELLNKREAGKYRAMFKIPAKWLNPGKYKALVFLIHSGTRERLDMIEAIRFEVLDDGSPVYRYKMSGRKGVLQPYIKWETKKLD